MPTQNDNPGIQPINTTNYFHYRDPNLNRVENVMDYDGEGKPALRILDTNAGAASNSAFGEQLSVPLTPVIQLDALYEFDPREFQTFTANGGSILQDTNKTLFQAHTGTQAYGYAVIRSNRQARYRPGQGLMARFTAMYDHAQAGVTLRAGLIGQEQSLVIGYNGTQFGILRQNGGKAQIVKLTITSNTVGTAVITLNGVATNVSLTSTNTTTSAVQIAATAFTGWQTQQVDNVVWFLADLVGVQSGANSVGGTATGTISVVQTGVAHTDNWIYQADWNIDKLDGTGTSGVTLDPSKLNIFQIQFRWLGAGEIRWAVENPINGDLIYFHHIHYSNRNTTVHLDNPSFRIGYAAYNSNATTITDAHVHGASMMVAIEGNLVDNSWPTGAHVIKKSLAQDTVHGLMELKNKLIHRDKINLRRVQLKTLTVAFQGNDPAVISLFLNATSVNAHTFNKVADYSCVALASGTTSYTYANEQPLAEFVIPINGSGNFDLDKLGLVIPPNSRLNVAISSAQSISSIAAAVTWVET